MLAPFATARLDLRPFTADDLPALHAMWCDPEIGPWVGGTHTEVRQIEEELGIHLAQHERHGFGMWAVAERGTGRLVGEVGLTQFENRGPEIEIGWCVVRDVWGAGYAREAAEAWLAAGFGELGLDRVIAVVLPHNARSRGLCRRLGMAEAGQREAYGATHVLHEVSAEKFSRG